MAAGWSGPPIRRVCVGVAIVALCLLLGVGVRAPSVYAALVTVALVGTITGLWAIRRLASDATR